MKMRFTACLLFFVAVIIVSCKKEMSTPDAQPPVVTVPTASANGDQFVGWRQGLPEAYDTLFKVSYDVNKRIKSVENTTYGSIYNATYDGAGNLTVFTQIHKGVLALTVNFKYNADNLLEEFDPPMYSGSKSRYTYQYTNGILSRKTYYTVTNQKYPTTLNIWRYYTYEATNGNITSRKEYDSENKLVGETTFTYTNDKNIFRSLCMFNFINDLGLYDVASVEKFFNKNLIATETVNGVQRKFSYTYNENKQLTGLVVSYPGAIRTRTWFY
ncbi:hypothetical protein [Chitinophaga nivalis]|uniref:DUF4595 domain-containing protein n=1 Tax=Chitinophaga nivalis TaxID=2991709 RepID=A0ABT3IEY4_9BACT|nr:hypothetical protein [Chitinophaga nivalis]MCW3467842.1 hypothetical protein [Chitinophaga nivalis]MCW3482466.1 hypothetical protein [Chitinophaga nivalis]